MNTIFFLSTSNSTTEEHTFKTTTAGGREMIISVTASKDITAKAVLADVQQSFPPGTQIEPKVSSPGFGGALLLCFFGWILLGGIFMIGLMVSDAAGFVNWLGLGDPTTWPDWLPMIGGLTLQAGLVRLWLLLGLVGFIAFNWLWRAAAKREKSKQG